MVITAAQDSSTAADPWGPFAQECADATWIVLLGTADHSLLKVLCSTGAPVLVVEPDESLLDQRAETAAALGLEGVVFLEQLVGAQAEEKPWFRYNDSRQNGVLSLSDLKPRYPNLRLEGIEMRQQISLSQLLASWDPAQADGGLLVLPGHVGAEWLENALPSLQKLRLLALGSPVREASASHSTIEALLRKAWLVRQPLEASQSLGMEIWLRDSQLQFQATVLAERDRLRSQVLALEEEKLSLISERDGVMAEREKFRGQVRKLEDRMAAINRELDEILALMELEKFESVDPSSID